MEIQLNLDGRKRKEAADCVGEAVNIVPVYLRSGHSYNISDGIILDRQGVLTIDDCDEALPKVLLALQKAGFYSPEEAPPQPVEEPLPEPEPAGTQPEEVEVPSEPAEPPPDETEVPPDEAEADPVEETVPTPISPAPVEEAPPQPVEEPPTEEVEALPDEVEASPEDTEPVEEAPPEEEDPPEPIPLEEAEPPPEPGHGERLVIQMPLEGFPPEKTDNLCRLVASKASLIKKAIGVESLPIAYSPTTIDFPWVPEGAQSSEIMAYAQFVSKLCDMAKTQQRVLAVEHPVENEKYAFRCFLLRLGFIGEEYAEARRILMRNLEGNGSHKSGDGKPRGPKTPPAPMPASVATVVSEPAPAAEPAPKSRFKKMIGGLKMLLAVN
jgi:hypothetical protein